MAFNGSGVFIRLYNWVQDAANSIPITASRMDAETQGIADGLTNCITKDGQSLPSADITLNNHKLTNVSNPTASGDAVNKGYADGTYSSIAAVPVVLDTFASLGTALATVNQVVTIRGHTTFGIGGGQFIAKAGSVTNDGGRQINSATGGLYWSRTDPLWHIEQFGAIPDHISAGFDCTSAINAIISAAPSTGVGVKVGDGKYNHQAGIQINKVIAWYGSGKYSSQLQKTTAGTGFTALINFNSVFKDIGFIKKSGFTDSAIGHGLYIQSGRTYCENLYFSSHGGDGLLIEEANASHFIGIESVSNGQHGIHVNGRASPNNNANAMFLANLDVRVNGNAGLYMENCFSNTVTNLISQGNATGYYFGPLTQLCSMTGVYTEANTGSTGGFNGTANYNRVDYVLQTEAAQPSDSGSGNMWTYTNDITKGKLNLPAISSTEYTMGLSSSGSPGNIRYYDTGTENRFELQGTASDAVLNFVSSGAGKLISKFQSMYEDSSTLTLLNSWTNTGAGFGSATVYKDATGRCYLAGVIQGGGTTSGTIIATLPALYRPASARRFNTNSLANPIQLNLATNGNLTYDAGTGSTTVTLDGLNYHL